MTKVIHLTSVHSAGDPRVFLKECRSLAEAGFEVTLIAPHTHDEVLDGVQIRAISPPASRFRRITWTVWQIYRTAAASDAEVCHIHDPELIPVGLLLKLGGKKIVYDVHEDYVTSIRQKQYLPRPLRTPLSIAVLTLEHFARKWFAIILAERYYLQRFPAGILVLNYPRRELLPYGNPPPKARANRIRLLYTGVVSEDRGAFVHASLVSVTDDIDVYVVGRCDADLAAAMRHVAGPGSPRLHITGEGVHVPYGVILDAYQQGDWTAGLALFPDTPHYRNKELTKFFEYMAAGIPIVCSNIGTWVSLVERIGCGLCVDPRDPEAILAAVRYLVDHPDEAAEMGYRGRKAVDTRFNWAHEADSLIRFYSDELRITPSVGQASMLRRPADISADVDSAR